MNYSTGFEISKDVVYDTIDGEVVLVHLRKGHYYSLMNAGRSIWELIVEGLSIDQVMVELQHLYEGSAVEIKEATEHLVNQFIDEEIIRENPSHELQKIEHKPKKNIEKQPFLDPVMEKSTDMERILLLDPVHEVDELGWPKQPQDR